METQQTNVSGTEKKKIVHWYDMNEAERISNVYSKYTIKDFWDWWSDGKDKHMEVRIKNIELIKELCYKYRIPMSASGLYVNTADRLKLVIQQVREKATVWFGVNPRKRNFNRYGSKKFGGKDANVEEIKFIFLDVDRIKKDGAATNYELYNADQLAEAILDELRKENWANSYAKLSSGNGVQLLIKLDVPIKLFPLEYDNEVNNFIPNPEFDNQKNIIKNGIGKKISKFSKNLSERFGCDVDATGFNMGRVAALPFTKNFKFGSFTWRGIIHLENSGPNTGLTDYIESIQDKETFKQSKRFKYTPKLDDADMIIPGKMRENRLVDFFLRHSFKTIGGFNNTIWKDMKCLFYQSGITIDPSGVPKPEHASEFYSIHKDLEHIHQRKLTLNVPNPTLFKFNRDNINKWLMRKDILLKPLYPLWSTRTVREKIYPVDVKHAKDVINVKTYSSYNFVLQGEPYDELWKAKQRIDDIRTGVYDPDGDFDDKYIEYFRKNEISTFYSFFITHINETYGEKVADYFVENILDDFFNKHGEVLKYQ